MKRASMAIIIGAMIVAAVGVGWAFGARQSGQGAATVPIQPAATPATAGGQDQMFAARVRGSEDAPMTMYEVADFQCPACRVFFVETLPTIEREYVRTGKLRIVFVNFPLVSIHPNAAAAHEFAMCAAQQNRFWPIHDLLYANQDRWASLGDPAPYFRILADSAALVSDALSTCLDSGEMRAPLMHEAQGAYNAGVRSTPSFVVEGGLVQGAAPIESWRPLLDSIFLAKTATTGRPPGG
ncbi:MAG TPA: thioredoxin domain-containing protein [Gemmatimonadales bacterium]